MALRPIRDEERILIEHLLHLRKDAKRYQIPGEVENVGEGAIQLSPRGDHAADLVEAEYKDTDGRQVLITLSANQFDELYDLDIWKTDFSSLQQYPLPAKVKLLS